MDGGDESPGAPLLAGRPREIKRQRDRQRESHEASDQATTTTGHLRILRVGSLQGGSVPVSSLTTQTPPNVARLIHRRFSQGPPLSERPAGSRPDLRVAPHTIHSTRASAA